MAIDPDASAFDVKMPLAQPLGGSEDIFRSSAADEGSERRKMVALKALKALAGTELALFAQDRDLRYTWVFNADESWLPSDAEGRQDADILSGVAAERATVLKREVLRTQRPARFELSTISGSSTRWFDIRVDVDRDNDGTVSGILGTSIEITDQKRREETLKTLLRELSHRSKNLLAIIQSLASQTARHSITVPEFLVRFRGRIQSLAYSQDIVTDADWRGADLMSLVRTQVERYAPDGMEQVGFAGTDVYLSPTASLHVGLALHELAVNAASYGSLSVPGGRVSISAGLVEKDSEVYLQLTWLETAGPRVKGERDSRFGTSTLERIVPNSVGGEARLDYHADGIRYTLLIPDSQFESISGGTLHG
ncbi:HWE histidine kinase domain-containing protein [Mangrovibrevibacter kandeliae]|uniref:HWE histidine kinase domain-containing protein n=1 Tax=Mangrovibrevibacter kandeliae TaxID=2968473 RepID=UPI0021178437|nr:MULTISPECIES: HWE histidine kinase domain-containing protein [unclassified Aurantimonas]MCQ8780958.1 PAS domain-containing protein [Aurantimonas sp. CSK15Z-1]MCW4113739.1 PAS domain-containing protein [Aurantimonas sp. MSK8Z-1]